MVKKFFFSVCVNCGCFGAILLHVLISILPISVNVQIREHSPANFSELTDPSEGFPTDLDIDVETESELVELNLHKTSMSDAAPVLLQRGGTVIKVPFQRSEVRDTCTHGTVM